MSEFKGWICDVCGNVIEKVEDGWVEWIAFLDPSGNPKERNLRLTHNKLSSPRKSKHGCQFDDDYECRKDKGVILSLSLKNFLGPDGLMLLLSFIAENKLPIQEVLEMIKRLHIPGYEHARFYFDEAISEDVFESNVLEGYYRQSDINTVLKYIIKKNKT